MPWTPPSETIAREANLAHALFAISSLTLSQNALPAQKFDSILAKPPDGARRRSDLENRVRGHGHRDRHSEVFPQPDEQLRLASMAAKLNPTASLGGPVAAIYNAHFRN